MDKVALDLGFIQIYWYSIFIFIAMITACAVIYKEAKKRNINEEFLINLTFDTIIIGIIGARIYYVLFNLPYYLSNPVEILEIWNGGLAIHGGIFAALLFIIYYCKSKKVLTLKMLDIIVVGLIIGQAIGRWGNFFNGEAYGAITSVKELQSAGIPQFVINGMYILGEYRQPAFFYESVWCLFGFLAMLIVRRDKNIKRGQLTGFYLIWYGMERLLIEGIRADSLMLGPIKIAQVVSVIFVLAGLYLMFYYKKHKTERDQFLYRVDPLPEEQRVYFK